MNEGKLSGKSGKGCRLRSRKFQRSPQLGGPPGAHPAEAGQPGLKTPQTRSTLIGLYPYHLLLSVRMSLSRTRPNSAVQDKKNAGNDRADSRDERQGKAGQIHMQQDQTDQNQKDGKQNPL